MRYGNPSIRSALENLKNKNFRKILVLPLFPQYSATTTGSIFDEVTKVISTWRWVPSLNFINSYHDNDNFIDAISSSVKSKFEEINPHKIIFTYHGIPKKYFDQGLYIVYVKTSRLVAEKLGIKEENFITTSQDWELQNGSNHVT